KRSASRAWALASWYCRSIGVVGGAASAGTCETGSATAPQIPRGMDLHRPDPLVKCWRPSPVRVFGMRATLLLWMAASTVLAQAPKQFPPESEVIRVARAARRSGGPIKLDGRMDEPAWQAAPLEEGFRQVSPDEGDPATVRTAFRVLWDDEYLY